VRLLLEGIDAQGEISESARQGVMGELRRHFRPEFLNRVDATVLFKPLRVQEIAKIVVLLLADLQSRLADRKISLELTPAALEFVATEGFDPVFGARPLKRFLQQHLETRLGRAIISGEVGDGMTVIADVEDGKLIVRSRAAQP